MPEKKINSNPETVGHDCNWFNLNPISPFQTLGVQTFIILEFRDNRFKETTLSNFFLLHAARCHSSQKVPGRTPCSRDAA